LLQKTINGKLLTKNYKSKGVLFPSFGNDAVDSNSFGLLSTPR